MECSITICVRALTSAMTQLHREKKLNFGAVSPEIKFLICILLYGYWAKIDLHLSCWHFQTHWTIEISRGTFKAAMVHVRLVYKFGGLLSSTFAVDASQLCTAGIDQHSG